MLCSGKTVLSRLFSAALISYSISLSIYHHVLITFRHSLSLLDLLLKDALESLGISGKLADTLAELVHSHGGLVEVESEERLVLEVALLLNVKR